MSDTCLPPPEKYDDTNTHPDLCRSNWVITTGAELALLLRTAVNALPLELTRFG